jgi:hypothetical protein
MAPSTELLTITRPDPIKPYTGLIHAIGMVETKGDTLAYNPVEQAVGVFQIRPVRLKDYNKRTGSRYIMKDLYNYKISEKIFLYYASKASPNDFEKNCQELEWLRYQNILLLGTGSEAALISTAIIDRRADQKDRISFP